jgi:hypothetical protein
MLGCIEGTELRRRFLKSGVLIPWCFTEHRSPLRKGPQGRGMDAARFSPGHGWPVGKPPQRMRSAGHPVRDETQGVLSFGSVFFAQAKKMTKRQEAVSHDRRSPAG